jgi:hypothetical protein
MFFGNQEDRATMTTPRLLEVAMEKRERQAWIITNLAAILPVSRRCNYFEKLSSRQPFCGSGHGGWKAYNDTARSYGRHCTNNYGK